MVQARLSGDRLWFWRYILNFHGGTSFNLDLRFGRPITEIFFHLKANECNMYAIPRRRKYSKVGSALRRSFDFETAGYLLLRNQSNREAKRGFAAGSNFGPAAMRLSLSPWSAINMLVSWSQIMRAHISVLRRPSVVSTDYCSRRSRVSRFTREACWIDTSRDSGIILTELDAGVISRTRSEPLVPVKVDLNGL